MVYFHFLIFISLQWIAEYIEKHRNRVCLHWYLLCSILYLTNLFGCVVWNVVNRKWNGLAYISTYTPTYILAKFIEAQHRRHFTHEWTLVSCVCSHFIWGLNNLCCKCKNHSKGKWTPSRLKNTFKVATNEYITLAWKNIVLLILI